MAPEGLGCWFDPELEEGGVPVDDDMEDDPQPGRMVVAARATAPEIT